MFVARETPTSRSKNRLNFRQYKVLLWLVSHLLVGTIAFHVGFTLKTDECPPCEPTFPIENSQMKNLDLSRATPSLPVNKMKDSNETLRQQLPRSIQKMFVGMGRVRRDDFATMFDVGVPLMPSSKGNEEVLIFYGDKSSLPSNTSTSSVADSGSEIPRISSPEEATKNCLTMNMIFIQSGKSNDCVALMGQWRSHIVYKWMREGGDGPARFDRPWQMVSRTRQQDSKKFLDYPDDYDNYDFFVREGFDLLQKYLLDMHKTVQKLYPVAKASANPKGNYGFNNTIIVMLCSHGQAEMFINFVCSARARGLDTTQVLLFPTDLEMKKLAEGMGITTFYDEKMFGGMSLNPSNAFGDRAFKRFMLAKVYCLHLISQLRFNILFQDADVMWYRNPLAFFASPRVGNFDIYIQDDGTRNMENEAYHGNGGFFYIRSNKRTAYFLSNLARRSDFILKKNEQVAINVLLNEHASFTGLRVKTLDREEADFVGGWQFHRRPEYMQKVIQGNVTPYIFHMSWTRDKTEKLQYLEQMGYLFVTERCMGKAAFEMLRNRDAFQHGQNLTSSCCVADPVVRCHYSNKPSKIPCDKSPPI